MHISDDNIRMIENCPCSDALFNDCERTCPIFSECLYYWTGDTSLVSHEKKEYTITHETVELLRHIFDARIDNATNQSSYVSYCNARDFFEYALVNNTEALSNLDYLKTSEEK